MAAGRTAGWSHWSHTVAVLSANIAAYGALWVVQYQMLDRVLFRTGGGAPRPLPTPIAPALDGRASAVEEVSLAPCGTSWGDGLTR